MAGKRFTVDAVFRGINKISKPARSMGRSISKFVRKSSRELKKLGRKFEGLSKKITQVAAIAIVGLGLVMTSTTAKGVEFEQVMVSAAAKFPGLIRQGTKEFKALEAAAKKTGKETEFSATQSANAINFLAMAGFNAKQSIAALPGVVDLATAANLDLARATDIATDTLGAFGLATKDPIKLAENLGRVNDVLARTTTSANTNMEQLFESIAAGGADFKTAGQSIESFAALTGIMANAGKKGEKAGTVLRNVMVRLAKPTGEAAGLLKKMGIRTEDQAGNFRDVVDILADFEKGLKGMGTAQKTATISTIFGLRAQGGINILLKAGTKEIRKFRKGLLDAKGASSEMAKAMRDTLQGRINSLKSSFEGLQLTLFDLEKGPLTGIITKITKVIRVVDSAIINNKDFAKSLTGDINNVISGGIKVFGAFVIAIVALKIALLAAAGVMLIYNTAMLMVKATMFLLKGIFIISRAAILAYNGSILAVRIGLIALAAQQVIVNAVMAVNPFVLIGVAIVALIAGIVLLVKNWDMVKNTVVGVWDSIVGTVKSSIDTILGFIQTVTQPFDDLFKGISGLKSKFSFIFGGDENNGEKSNPRPVTPQERLSRSIEENTSRSIEQTENNSTLTINDRTGRAELSPQKRGGPQIALASSGDL